VLIGDGLASAIVSKPGRAQIKFVEDAVKEAIKRGLQSSSTDATGDARDLKTAFRRTMVQHRQLALIQLNETFARMHDRLAVLSKPELETLAATLTARLTQHHSSLMKSVADQTVIAWTNFIAQVKHGAMGDWDLWERNGSKGAIALDGATPRPDDAVGAHAATASNIDPRAASALNRANDSEHFGILEIATTPGGGLLEDGRGMHYGHDYGMRLENVGGGVRDRIRTLGRVRDVPVNKMVRVYEVSSRSVSPVGSFLITADGHVRQYDLVPAIRPNLRPHTMREQLGIDQRPFNVDHEKTELRVTELAERVQELPLSRLRP
jgi:hypothetical protein